jgi:hypothetical protein
MKKINWLPRHISPPAPYLCLCLSEDEYLAAFKHMDVKPRDEWIKTPQADATTHFLKNKRNELVVIVCLSGYENRTPIEMVGLIIHEVVHIWQEWCAYYGETHPASEQEAYAIQNLSQTLMEEFERRMKND